MKVSYFIIALASCLSTLFTSCSDSLPYSEDAYNNAWIDAYPSYISLDEDELSGEFYVSTTNGWYIYSSPFWVNILYNSYGYGYAYDDVYFTVDENSGNSTRYGDIKIRTFEGITKETTVTIAQPPTTQFEATMYYTNFSSSSSYNTLIVKAASSRSWTISKSDSWVHLGNSYNSSYSYNGSGMESVSIYVDSNPSYGKRSSYLTVECGSKSKTITITQNGK